MLFSSLIHSVIYGHSVSLSCSTSEPNLKDYLKNRCSMEDKVLFVGHDRITRPY